jgi:RNA polymerase sigma-70 factor (ECF subfamily)
MPANERTRGAWLGEAGAAKGNQFETTLWTMVLAAGKRTSVGSDEALARLCRIYWPPVYAFVRNRSASPEQAKDLTQAFFARLLEKNQLSRAERSRGRFRSFLMTSVQHFLCDQHDRASTVKRGGGIATVSLDAIVEEEEHRPRAQTNPAQEFEKRWAIALLAQVMDRLSEEYRQSDRLSVFEHLQPHLWGDADSKAYTELAERLKMSPVNVRVTAHRLRQRYREILREEIARTVCGPEEVEDELRYLLQVVSG